MKQGKSSIAKPLTTNKHLIRWVEKMAELTQPAAFTGWMEASKNTTGSATSWWHRGHSSV